MNPIFLYLLKASLSLTIFYGFYTLIYKREAFFNFNRVFLLFSLLVTSLLPLFSFNIFSLAGSEVQLSEKMLYYAQLPTFQLNEIVSNESMFIDSFSLILIVTYIYIIVVLFKSVQFLLHLNQISIISNSNQSTYKHGVRFVLTKNDLPVFSFFKRIFIDEETFKKKDAEKIIEHEKVHIQQFHSVDLILAEIVCIFHWFNPFAYLIKKAIKENHEFIADRLIISKQADDYTYRILLMKHATQIKTNILTHNFSYSLLKRRLHMMKKKKSIIRFTFNLLWVTPVLFLVLFACSSPKEEQGGDVQDGADKIEVKQISPAEASNESGEVFQVVEKQPQFPGGTDSLYAYLSKAIKYPEQAKRDSITGRVFVSFVVEKDGGITNVLLERGIGGGCDEESMRVIAEMPKWKPGLMKEQPVRVKFTLPIKFALK